jgi:hypothetical protein
VSRVLPDGEVGRRQRHSAVGHNQHPVVFELLKLLWFDHVFVDPLLGHRLGGVDPPARGQAAGHAGAEVAAEVERSSPHPRRASGGVGVRQRVIPVSVLALGEGDAVDHKLVLSSKKAGGGLCESGVGEAQEDGETRPGVPEEPLTVRAVLREQEDQLFGQPLGRGREVVEDISGDEFGASDNDQVSGDPGCGEHAGNRPGDQIASQLALVSGAGPDLESADPLRTRA